MEQSQENMSSFVGRLKCTVRFKFLPFLNINCNKIKAVAS